MRNVFLPVSVFLLLLLSGVLQTQKRWAAPDHETVVYAADESCRLGTSDLLAMRYEDALPHLDRSLELMPGHVEASVSRAAALAGLGDEEAFRIELARADSLAARLADPERRMLAQLRLGMLPGSGFHPIGDSLLARLQESSPGDIHVLTALAKHPDTAPDKLTRRRLWLQILESDPNHVEAYSHLGDLDLALGRPGDAISHLQKAVFLRPGSTTPRIALAEALLQVGRYEEATDAFRSVTALDVNEIPAWVGICRAQIGRGHARSGIVNLGLARQLVDEDRRRQLDLELVSLCLQEDLRKSLLKFAARYIADNPLDQHTGFVRGIRLVHMGRVDDAKVVVDSTLAIWRRSPAYRHRPEVRRRIERSAHEFDALAADTAGNLEAGAWHWLRALALDRDGPTDARRFHASRLAADLLRLGRPHEALGAVNPLLAVNPRRADLLVFEVQCLLDLGRTEAAFVANERLASLVDTLPAYHPAVAAAAGLQVRLRALASER